jgi:hypothetical protein
MCDFPYLAVVMRPGEHDPQLARHVADVSKRHGLVPIPISPSAGSFVARFAERAELVVSFAVEQCACDWKKERHQALAAVARELLDGRDVLRVRFGVWTIRGDVDEGDPRRSLDLMPRDTRAELGPWTSPYAIELARHPEGPHPRRRLRDVAAGHER